MGNGERRRRPGDGEQEVEEEAGVMGSRKWRRRPGDGEQEVEEEAGVMGRAVQVWGRVKSRAGSRGPSPGRKTLASVPLSLKGAWANVNKGVCCDQIGHVEVDIPCLK